VLAGQLTGTTTVTINPTADTIDELDETVIATITSGTGYTISSTQASATGAIVDDDIPVASVSVSPASVNEDGETNLVYTVTLDRAPVVDTVVNLNWTGTATPGTDFTGTRPATITVLAGQTSGSTTVTIDPTADTIDELDETVIATITSGSGYTISSTQASATGTILDNDTVSVASVTSDTQEEGTPLVHTVTLSGAADRELSFAYTLGGGTATVTSDYTTPQTFSNGVTLVGGNLIIPTGVTSFTITTATVDDALDENSELYNLSVGGVPATGTILDNDVPVASVSVSPASVDEDGSTSLVYTVRLDIAPVVDTVVNLRWSGTATPGTDFTGTRPASITVLAGELTGRATVTIDPTADTIVEPDETVIATINSGPGYTISPTQASATGTIVDNDEALLNPLGLSVEYYGYNDFNPTSGNANRQHSDDGTFGNLDSVAKVTALINGRNSHYDGGNVVGSTVATQDNATDVRFTATTLDYGRINAVNNSLGTNPDVAAGAGSPISINRTNSELFKFVNKTPASAPIDLRVTLGTPDNDNLSSGPTSGLGKTSDAAMRFTGQAYLAAGLYDIRVTADDGFRLRLDDQTVAIFDGNQVATTRVYSGVAIEGGPTPLELIYWEQAGKAVLRVEFKLSSDADSSYKVLGSSTLPLFSDVNAPVLTELQDIVAGAKAGTYAVRTGSLLQGGAGDDQLTGGDARDHLIGGDGRDVLAGGAASDVIEGGKADDQLTGGLGHDVFRWSLGDAGSTTAPAHDVISDFDNTSYAGDVLDLRDLLTGETHAANTTTLPNPIGLTNALKITADAGNLADYLHFTKVGSDTVIEISSKGNFTASSHAAVDQVITLERVDLTTGFNSDTDIIKDLLARGKLITDVSQA